MPTTGGGPAEVGPFWHGAKWLAVLSSVADTCEQVGSSDHGGVHDTTRQEIRTEQAIS